MRSLPAPLLSAMFALLIAAGLTATLRVEARESKLCQDLQTKDVRTLRSCPSGSIEVFALERSVKGGYWTEDGQWVGQVIPRKDYSPKRRRSEQDEAAHDALLRRVPDHQ
jgi:hypothetical protein